LAHTTAHKEQILLRLKKIKGQISALERALENDNECFKILQQIAACRGAMNALMQAVLKTHIKEHLINANTKSKREEEVQNLLSILESFVK